MVRIEPSPAQAPADDKPVSAREAALRSTLEAMHSAPDRFRPLVRRLVEAELRLIRRRERARAPAGTAAAPGLPAADAGAEPPPAGVAVSASSETELPVRSPAAAGPVAMTAPTPTRPAQPKAAAPATMAAAKTVPAMTAEEGWSLAGWTGAALLVLASFVSGYPGRPARPATGPQVCVVLPVDPTRLSVAQLTRQPLDEIVSLADHSDPHVRGRMVSALVRRQEAGALIALARCQQAAVRQAVPAALAALGRLESEQAVALSADLVAVDPRARERAAELLARLDQQQAERVGLRPVGARQ